MLKMTCPFLEWTFSIGSTFLGSRIEVLHIKMKYTRLNSLGLKSQHMVKICFNSSVDKDADERVTGLLSSC